MNIGTRPTLREDTPQRTAETHLLDVTDAGAMSVAFDGAEGVFVLIPPLFDPSPDFSEIRAIITAVGTALREARPARVVVLSTVGAQATEPNLLSQLGQAVVEVSPNKLPVSRLERQEIFQ